MTKMLTGPRALVAVLLCLAPIAAARATYLHSAGHTPGHSVQSDLDDLMAAVLQHRDENWRKLHDYILRETESFVLDGPGGARLYGTEREFSWFTRDGYLVRSPVRYDKVTLSAAERTTYERDWLKQEQEREAEHAKRAAARAEEAAKAAATAAAAPGVDGPPVTDIDSFMREGGEPRFISEAYFLEFKFEPGNYYLAGRETLAGRDVLRIEYYPTRLFDDDDGKKKTDRNRKNDEFERKFNKVALVTLWVDPKVRQIVKFTFENVDFGFLPGRWLVRVGDVKATMVMSQPLPETWLPRELVFEADVTLAAGTFNARYRRDYFDYRQGEVRAKIRHYGPVPEPRQRER